jgi:hypothetical protein
MANVARRMAAMRIGHFLGLLIPLALCLLWPDRAAAADLTVRADEGFTVPMVVNGHQIRLRVDPEAPAYVMLNPGAARRIGLRPTLLGGIYAIVGPVRINGNTKSAMLSHDGRQVRQRFAWLDRDVIDGADGLISPAALPYDRVLIELGPAQEGESVTTFPMTYTTEYGLMFPVATGDGPVNVQFSTLKPRSMATAAAGARIAADRGGSWAGEAFAHPIEYGVSRPVRPLQLQQALAAHDFSIRQFLVRTSDNLGNHDLPADASADPREIVVTGVRARQDATYMLTIGLDGLTGCSRMVYEGPQHRMTLHCRSAAA